MVQADLTSFIPLSILFLTTFFLPIMVETNWVDNEGVEWNTWISSINIRRASC
jgi:hypothetical protein